MRLDAKNWQQESQEQSWPPPERANLQTSSDFDTWSMQAYETTTTTLQRHCIKHRVLQHPGALVTTMWSIYSPPNEEKSRLL